MLPLVRTLSCTQQPLLNAISGHLATSPDESLFVIDLGTVYRKAMQWAELLPSVTAFFAVKALPDDLVLRALMSLGVGFDCASAGEMEQLLRLGCDPKRIILSNPSKSPSTLAYSRDNGVEWMTFDNEYEAAKIKAIYPDAKFVSRISPTNLGD